MEEIARVYPGAAGLLMAVLAAIVTLNPPSASWAKWVWIIAFSALGLSAIAASLYAQHLDHQTKLAQQRADSDRDSRLEYMKGQLDAMVRQGSPQEETRRIEIVVDTFKSMMGVLGGQRAGTGGGELADIQNNLDTLAKEQARRKAVREQLGQLLEQGRMLMEQCAKESEPPPQTEANGWAQRVEEVLDRELDASYIARFRSGAGILPLSPSIASEPHKNLWRGIYQRTARLEQFLQEQSR